MRQKKRLRAEAAKRRRATLARVQQGRPCAERPYMARTDERAVRQARNLHRRRS